MKGPHYNRHRYYDPATGRYVSADPIGQAGVLAAAGVATTRIASTPGSSPTGPVIALLVADLNPFGYGLNSPVNLIDPTGEVLPVLPALAVALGGSVLVGGGVSLVVAAGTQAAGGTPSGTVSNTAKAVTATAKINAAVFAGATGVGAAVDAAPLVSSAVLANALGLNQAANAVSNALARGPANVALRQFLDDPLGYIDAQLAKLMGLLPGGGSGNNNPCP